MNMIWYRRILVAILCLMLAFGSTFALGESTTPSLSVEKDTTDVAANVQSGEVLADPTELTSQTDDTTVLYTATASYALKVRREAKADAAGNGSIDKGDQVSILELGDEWCKVFTGRNIGYVQTKYLTDVQPYVETQPDVTATQTQDAIETDTATAAQETPSVTAEPDTSADTPAAFHENFQAYAIRTVTAHRTMNEKGGSLFAVLKYEEVTVGAVHGDWCYIHYKTYYGYIRTDALFKWDRIDPYAGDIPGLTKRASLVFVNKSTDIMSYDDNGKEVLKTVNPGSALAVDPLDSENRYPLAYWRTYGYVNEADVGYKMDVVPWEDAQSGDMISCMTTYYAVGVSTLNYQGRNWNIYLGSSFISGTVLQPGETANIYDIMGPYRASTGYHRAPIMSPNALWGYGGGTCQVNTTLYNVLIQVPIYINWRKVHANVGIYYCPVGFDAAVGGGDITMIFTNTLPYAFRINYFMSDGVLTVALFRV